MRFAPGALDANGDVVVRLPFDTVRVTNARCEMPGIVWGDHNKADYEYFSSTVAWFPSEHPHYPQMAANVALRRVHALQKRRPFPSPIKPSAVARRIRHFATMSGDKRAKSAERQSLLRRELLDGYPSREEAERCVWRRKVLDKTPFTQMSRETGIRASFFSEMKRHYDFARRWRSRQFLRKLKRHEPFVCLPKGVV